MERFTKCWAKTFPFTHSLTIVLILAVLVTEIRSQSRNQCDRIPARKKLDFSRLYGFWYKTGGTPYNGFEGNSACETMESTYVNNETLRVIARHYDSKISKKAIDYDVLLTQTPKGTTHTLLHAPINITMPYWRILDTDYATYAIIYACIDDLSGRYTGSLVWCTSRYGTFHPYNFAKCLTKVMSLGIKRANWYLNLKSSC